MELKLHSYPKLYNLGHGAIRDLFSGPVEIQEKIDGSQFSFGLLNGELFCRSKSAGIILDKPEAMFRKAVETCQALKPLLKEGYTYRGEYLEKPKHNTLAYDRTPKNHIILFDINPGQEQYLPYEEVVAEGTRIGLEVVPRIRPTSLDAEGLLGALDQLSVLGGQKIEGFVIKNYTRFAADGKALMGKFVSEAFKEIHGKDWKDRNPGTKDLIELMAQTYRTEARWQKAVQHLRERGELTSTPSDIGKLIAETQKDLEEECGAEIKERLFEKAWPKIARSVAGGLPQWYKEQLLKSQFETVTEEEKKAS